YLAVLYYELGQYHLLSGDLERSKTFAILSVQAHINDASLWLIRKLKNESSKNTKLFDIDIEAKLNPDVPDLGVLGFYKSFEVAAENDKEALDYIVELLEDIELYTIRIDQIEVSEKSFDQIKGVYYMSAYHFYENE
ncbi:hypothetical protein MJH12_15905, partial [bacterium]|nr:hypothetical protein [bacterium]